MTRNAWIGIGLLGGIALLVWLTSRSEAKPPTKIAITVPEDSLETKIVIHADGSVTEHTWWASAGFASAEVIRYTAEEWAAHEAALG